MARLSDEQVMLLLKSDALINRARKEFSNNCGLLDQAGRQRKPLTPIEMRRMEFEAVMKIASVLGVEL